MSQSEDASDRERIDETLAQQSDTLTENDLEAVRKAMRDEHSRASTGTSVSRRQALAALAGAAGAGVLGGAGGLEATGAAAASSGGTNGDLNHVRDLTVEDGATIKGGASVKGGFNTDDLSSKNTPVIDVTNPAYGAVPQSVNSTNDQTAAIQAAFNAIPSDGGVLYFPPGYYPCSTLEFGTQSGQNTGNVLFWGWGAHLQNLNSGGTATAPLLHVKQSNSKFIGFGMNGYNNGASGGDAVHVTDESRFLAFENINSFSYDRHYILDASGSSAVGASFKNVRCSRGSQKPTSSILFTSGGGATAVEIEKCNLMGTDAAIDIQDGRQIKLDRVNISLEADGAVGVRYAPQSGTTNKSSWGVDARNVFFEANTSTPGTSGNTTISNAVLFDVGGGPVHAAGFTAENIQPQNTWDESTENTIVLKARSNARGAAIKEIRDDWLAPSNKVIADIASGATKTKVDVGSFDDSTILNNPSLISDNGTETRLAGHPGLMDHGVNKIASGATSTTVSTHIPTSLGGLSEQQNAIQDVQVTPVGGLGGANSFYVSPSGSPPQSTFQLNLTSAPSSDVYFAWDADISNRYE